ncbi:MAG: PP2C family protein-serine/threonine phosphatase [Phycisphaerae bacterium]
MSHSDTTDPRDLQQVLEITRTLAVEMDHDALLRLIIDRSVELLDAERGSLFLYDRDNDELYSTVATGTGEIRFPADRGIAGATIRGGKVLNVPDAYADDRFNPEVDRRTGFRTRNILCLPLRDYENELVGVLQVLNKRGGPFGRREEELAETLAAQAGVALQRAGLMRHYAEKQEMERAMSIARDIQRSLLPQHPPRIDGYDVAAFSRPADDTGGDVYDFLVLPDGRHMLVVADATGHGIGPALVIAETRAMLRAISCSGCDISAVLETANNLLHEDLGDDRFVTCFLGVLDAADARLQYAAAGHGPLLFYAREADRFARENATAVPLGIMDSMPFDDLRTVELAVGDFAAITTDGYFEAENDAGEMFGIERVEQVLRESRDLSAAEMIARLTDNVDRHATGLPQGDDLTAVVVKRTS